jgi:hypothetical protein
MTAWLLEHAADKKIFVIGEAPLTSALLAAGLTLTEDAREVDIVVASYDRTFEYRKLQIAFDALAVHRRAILVTTNPDVFCPFRPVTANRTRVRSSPPSKPAPARNARRHRHAAPAEQRSRHKPPHTAATRPRWPWRRAPMTG